jgi:hypothetical protein
MSDDRNSDDIQKEIADHIASQIAAAEAATRIQQQKREEAESAINSLAATINTPDALRQACCDYLNEEIFAQRDVVTWKDRRFQNRDSRGPFVVVESQSRSTAHRISADDGDEFNPGCSLWGEVLDLCVGHLGSENRFRIMWCDSRRMKLVKE